MNSIERRLYTVYGLRVVGESLFFYIGATIYSAEYRLSGHLASRKNGQDGNVEKCEILKKNKGKIEAVVIKSITTNRKKALSLEAKYIRRFLAEGHPLTNRMAKNMKGATIRISEGVHRRLKVYVAKNSTNMTSFVDKIIDNAIKV